MSEGKTIPGGGKETEMLNFLCKNLCKEGEAIALSINLIVGKNGPNAQIFGPNELVDEFKLIDLIKNFNNLFTVHFNTSIADCNCDECQKAKANPN